MATNLQKGQQLQSQWKANDHHQWFTNLFWILSAKTAFRFVQLFDHTWQYYGRAH